MLKYSVIGTSWITKSFIDGANLYEDLCLDGVYSRSFEKGSAFAKETGELLLLAGIEEIEKNGIQNLSMRKLAARCGISCAAPYKHFKDKEQMLGANEGLSVFLFFVYKALGYP